MGKWTSRLVFAFLIILATLGMAAYVMQNALQEPITFKEFFERAEKSNADVVSLTSNDEFAPHLQSFFLYMKPAALGVFFLHIFETPEQIEFYDVTRKLEVGLSEKFTEAEVLMESLYHTERPVFFAYDELISQGAGFIKRKLLERRFCFGISGSR